MPLRLFLVSILFWPFSLSALEIGSSSPEFTLPSVDKKMVSISDFKGKFVYLDFWASWCGPCKHSMPWMNQMKQRYGAKGLEIVTVNLDSDENKLKEFVSKYPTNFLVLRDPKGETPEKFGVATMPTSMLIDRKGRVVYIHSGFCESEQDAIEEVVQRSLSLTVE